MVADEESRFAFERHVPISVEHMEAAVMRRGSVGIVWNVGVSRVCGVVIGPRINTDERG